MPVNKTRTKKPKVNPKLPTNRFSTPAQPKANPKLETNKFSTPARSGGGANPKLETNQFSTPIQPQNQPSQPVPATPVEAQGATRGGTPADFVKGALEFSGENRARLNQAIGQGLEKVGVTDERLREANSFEILERAGFEGEALETANQLAQKTVGDTLVGAKEYPIETVAGLFASGAIGSKIGQGLYTTTRTAGTLGKVGANTKNAKLINQGVIKSLAPFTSMSTTAKVVLGFMISNVAFGLWARQETMGGMKIIGRDAREAGRYDLAQEAINLKRELEKEEVWKTAAKSAVGIGSIEWLSNFIKSSRLETDIEQQIVNDGKAIDAANQAGDPTFTDTAGTERTTAFPNKPVRNKNEKIAGFGEGNIEGGETPQTWGDYKLQSYDLEIQAAEEISKIYQENKRILLAMEKKASEEEAALLRKERALKFEQEAEERKRIAAFWKGYRQQVAEIENKQREDNSPSALSFGLL